MTEDLTEALAKRGLVFEDWSSIVSERPQLREAVEAEVGIRFSDDMLPLAKAGVPMASMLSCAEALPKLIDALEAQARKKAEALNRVAANAARVNSALDAIQSVVKVLGE
jgi:hypothetical protein